MQLRFAIEVTIDKSTLVRVLHWKLKITMLKKFGKEALKEIKADAAPIL